MSLVCSDLGLIVIQSEPLFVVNPNNLYQQGMIQADAISARRADQLSAIRPPMWIEFDSDAIGGLPKNTAKKFADFLGVHFYQ
jgi:hypothetical protein